MRSAARAIAWEFRGRHRWGLIAVAGYFLVIATIKLVILEPGQRLYPDDAQSFAFVVLGPLVSTFTYLLAVFSFGLSGDLAGRKSMYPPRMFTLPVTTAALAGWPMVYGAASVAALWLVTRLFAVWPSGAHVPLVWPALLAVSLLAWTQALTWMPYGLPGLRVIVAMLWLVVIDTVVLVALHFKAPEPVMLAILAPQVPLAYLVACVAVGRARRDDTPDWRGRFAVPSLSRRRDHFPSPARAQAWFEWKRHGRSLPALVGVLLPFELALLFVAGNAPGLVFLILLGVLLTPPFMAAFAASTVSGANMTPFIATRPLTNASLIAAKLKMTIWSTLAAWLLVLVAIPLALRLSGTWPMVVERVSRMIDTVGTPRAIVIALLVCSALLMSTWKQLVRSLYIGLSGREWVVKGNAFLLLLFLAFIGPIADWVIENRDAQAAVWDAIPWILAALMCVKLSAGAWIATRLHRRRLVDDRALVAGAAAWLAAVLALYGVLVWLVDTPLIARYFLALVAILAVPLARLTAAPLALAWNRHR